MGVERQGAKVNWLTSLAMIVMAGTFYRIRNITKSFTALKLKEILIKVGSYYPQKK